MQALGSWSPAPYLNVPSSEHAVRSAAFHRVRIIASTHVRLAIAWQTNGGAVLCGEPLIEPEVDALYVPGQELYGSINGMIGDALDDMSQIGPRDRGRSPWQFMPRAELCRTVPE